MYLGLHSRFHDSFSLFLLWLSGISDKVWMGSFVFANWRFFCFCLLVFSYVVCGMLHIWPLGFYGEFRWDDFNVLLISVDRISCYLHSGDGSSTGISFLGVFVCMGYIFVLGYTNHFV